jgi:hypothetical protein
MKYYLFIGDVYYATGGANDFIKSSTSLEELQKLAEKKIDDEFQWYHICDEEMKIVDRSEMQAHGN